jgi:hypothetical protein
MYESGLMAENSDYRRITADGWTYRTNGRGWEIYLDPQTRLWQTQSQAISVIQARVSTTRNGIGALHPTGGTPPFSSRQRHHDHRGGDEDAGMLSPAGE